MYFGCCSELADIRHVHDLFQIWAYRHQYLGLASCQLSLYCGLERFENCGFAIVSLTETSTENWYCVGRFEISEEETLIWMERIFYVWSVSKSESESESEMYR